MTTQGLLRALVAALLAMTIAWPALAEETTATLKLKLTPGTTLRYAIRGELYKQQTVTYDDESTESSRSVQKFEQVVRYDIGAPQGDGSAEATVTLESSTVQQDDDPPVTGTNVVQARARMLSGGALRDARVLTGTVGDLDRLSIGAFAFEYPAEVMTIGTVIDRPYPILLFVTWHSERISAHAQTQLTSLSPMSAVVTQAVDFHEADVPVSPGVVASADLTGTATHTIDRLDGWPRSGQAEARLEMAIDTSAAIADAPADSPVAVISGGSVSVLQTYERR